MSPELIAKILRLKQPPDDRPGYRPTENVLAGVETRTDPIEYRRDGMKRGGDPAYPFVVIQCTLEGWGAYKSGSQITRVESGHVLLAVVPTEHIYYLPRDSKTWTFFYIIVRHPYVVSRMSRSVHLAGAVHEMPPDRPLFSRLFRVFEGVYTRSFRDEFEEDEALLEFAVEFDRHANHLIYPRSLRDEVGGHVRGYILQHLAETIEVNRIAAEYGLTRTNFSHYFKSVTGVAPATFIRQVKLEEAARLLVRTDLKLEAISAAIGFSGASDFCKVFRKHYNYSPVIYRKQMQS